MQEPMSHELRRTRWLLWLLTVLFAAAGWVAGPILWALAVVCLVLAIKAEWLIYRLRRSS